MKPVQQPHGKMFLRKIGLTMIKTLLLTAVLIFVGKALWTELQQVSWNNLQVDPYFYIFNFNF